MTTSPADAPTMPSPDADESARSSSPEVARRDVVVVLGSFLVLGLAAGILWWLLVDPAQFTKAANGGLAMGEVELGKRFDDDGWFAVIAGVVGLFSGAVVTWWRSRDPLLTAVLVLVGSALAGSVMAALGGVLGPPDPSSVVAVTSVGDTVPMQLGVSGFVGYLVWPITALAGALLVLWSPVPDSTGPV